MIVFRAGNFEEVAGRPLHGSSRLGRPAQHPPVHPQVVNTVPCDAYGLSGEHAAAAQLGAQEDLTHAIDLVMQPVGAAYRLAKEAKTPEADAVVISCTSVRILELITAMEQDLGKPVIGAVQATMWDQLRLSGINPQCEGMGSLFRLGR